MCVHTEYTRVSIYIYRVHIWNLEKFADQSTYTRYFELDCKRTAVYSSNTKQYLLKYS